MGLPTRLFDASKYLPDNESQFDLLKDAFETGHDGYIDAAIEAVATARAVKDVDK
jgi:DNA-binding phage protein